MKKFFHPTCIINFVLLGFLTSLIAGCRKDPVILPFKGDYLLTIRDFGYKETSSAGFGMTWDSIYTVPGSIKPFTSVFDSIDRLNLDPYNGYYPFQMATLLVNGEVWISFPILNDGTVPEYLTYDDQDYYNGYFHTGTFFSLDSFTINHIQSNCCSNYNYSIKGVRN